MKTDNKKAIIAKFMGGSVDNGMVQFGDSDCTLVESLKYDTSWDLLMPVVETIEKLGTKCEIGITSCKIYSSEYTRETFYAATKIKAVYNHVVDFINWYNSQNS